MDWRSVVMRLFHVVVVLLVLHAVLFFIFRLLPNGLGAVFGWGAFDSRFRETMDLELGLGGTWIEQYCRHLKSVCSFDLGRTIRGRFPVGPELTHSVITSLPLFVAVIAGALAGPLVAVWRSVSQRVPTSLPTPLFQAGVISLPPFVIAAAAYALYRSVARSSAPSTQLTALWIAATLASAAFPFMITYALASRAIRPFVLAPFFRSLRSMGLTSNELRTALLPLVLSAVQPATARIAIGGLLSTAFVEILFGIPGYGRLGFQALRDADFSLMFGWVLSAAGLVVILAEVERWSARPA